MPPSAVGFQLGPERLVVPGGLVEVVTDQQRCDCTPPSLASDYRSG